MHSGTETDDPKPASASQRVLLVMPEHWSRVLLRAELIERGYDTVGAPNFRTALLYPPAEEQRGPVRAILIDDGALLNAADRRYLRLLMARHPGVKLVLLASATVETPPGPWDRVARRPLSIGQIAQLVTEVVGV